MLNYIFGRKENDLEKKRYLGFEIKKMDNIIFRQLKKKLVDAGFDEVTVMHGHILGYLCRHKDKDLYQKDIGEAFGIGKSSVTNILQLMEKKGYLVCRTDDNDGRCKKIVLTQKGEETHAATVKVIDMLHEELEQNVTEEEKRVHLPDGQWKLLSDGVSSALWKGPSRVCGGEVTLLPCSATIFGQV